LAEPSQVFVYRGETREVAAQLGVDVSLFPGAPAIPVVYHINFRDPSGYFLATQFDLQNKDVLYVATSPTVEVNQVLQMFGLVTATVNDPMIAAMNALNLRGAI